MAAPATHSPEEVRAAFEAWLDEAWDPALTVRDWWRRLAEARYAMPDLPEPWGRGYDRDCTRAVGLALKARDALGAPGGVGTALTAPTLLEHGTPEQLDRFLPRILDGTDGWCQLFSEPGAGSDLAGLQTRAVRDGDEWVVTGQKVWTSTGQHADFGILIARTDPAQPKHQGISYFLFPMHQPGVEVRPLREMTGHAVFNEVFFDEARAPHANLLGGLNQGWAVTNTTLRHERAGIGENESVFGRAFPGSVAGHLDRPAGEFLRSRPAISQGTISGRTVQRLTRLASEHGRLGDPLVRQRLAELHARAEIVRMTALRHRAGIGRTGVDGPLAKLRMTDLVRRARELGGLILGPQAQLWGPESETEGWLQEVIVFSPAPSIYGGTDEVQRNVVGERGLGLPKEPGPARDTPFRELLANAAPSGRG
ncbi:MAG: acyl-CoA dehydrogenase family protein [Acidimicrobiales bacterium]